MKLTPGGEFVTVKPNETWERVNMVNKNKISPQKVLKNLCIKKLKMSRHIICNICKINK
jgi:hypothetical protein